MSTSAGGSVPIDVAVGIVSAPDGRVLLCQRPPGKPYAGWWEFPGGKVEAGESAGEALARELHEELGLEILSSSPWLVRDHLYPHAHVRLHFRRIESWRGAPESREGQAFCWCDPASANVDPVLPATTPLLRLLALPPIYGISAAGEVGMDVFLARLDTALSKGLRLLQLREPDMPAEPFDRLFEDVLSRCRAHGARLLVNSRHPASYWARADGVHLRSQDIGSDRRGLPWVAASCHDAAQLRNAADTGVDFAVLGPVNPTRSHPDAAGMGWRAFAVLTSGLPLPVYGLGGLSADDLAVARASGAHGVAMIGNLFRRG